MKTKNKAASIIASEIHTLTANDSLTKTLEHSWEKRCLFNEQNKKDKENIYTIIDGTFLNYKKKNESLAFSAISREPEMVLNETSHAQKTKIPHSLL